MTTVVIVVAVVATPPAGVAALGAAGAGTAGAASSKSDKEKQPSSSNPSVSSTPPSDYSIVEAVDEAPVLKAAIYEQIDSFKAFISEDEAIQQLVTPQGLDELSFAEKAREAGAFFAHQAYEEVSELVSFVPQLCEELKDVGARILPDSLSLPNDDLPVAPKENYENLVATGHAVIDTVFSTDQADLYTAEVKGNALANEYAIGMIPLPGMISSNGVINVKKFSNLGKVADRAGFTKAGRGSMKHGYRKGSVFSKPVGNPSQVNQHGQQALESILNHPEKKVVQYTNKLYGPVIEIEAPKLGGVRFNGDGTEMMGFLEPKWFTNNP